MGEETEVQQLLDRIADLTFERQLLFNARDEIIDKLTVNYDLLAELRSDLADIS